MKAALPLCCLGVLMAVGQAASLGFPSIGVDDANIFLTYGRNLREGYGFVYAPGGERVEGTTSLLYTIVCAVAHLVPCPEPVLFFVNLCLLLLSLGIARSILALPGLGGDEGGATRQALFLVWLAIHPGIVFWTSLSLMDVALWNLLLVSAARMLVLSVSADDGKGSRGLTWLAPVMVLTRPEALVAVPALAALGWAFRSPPISSPRRGSSPLLAVGAAAATALALTAWRLWYFGYPLPNTYYAKVGNDLAYNLSQGGRYLLEYAAAFPLAGLAFVGDLVIAGAGLWRRLRPGTSRDATVPEGGIDDPGVQALAGLAAFLFVLPAFAGGDHFGLGRFLVTASLLLPLPVLAGLPLDRGPVEFGRTALVAAVVVAGGASTLWFAFLQEGRHVVTQEFRLAEDGRRLGRALGLALANVPSPTVAAYAVGGIGYEYRGRVLDVLGLNDTTVAHASRARYGPKNHAAFDRHVFLQMGPAFAFPDFAGRASGGEGRPGTRVLREVTKGLVDDGEFLSAYEEVLLARVDGSDWLEDPDFFASGWLRPLRRAMAPLRRTRLIRVFARKDVVPAIAGAGVAVLPPGG